MRVLYLTGNLRDADFIEHELRNGGSQIHLDVTPEVSDALARLNVSERYQVVLVDWSLPDGAPQNFIAQIRELSLVVAVVLIAGPGAENSLLPALKAGADDYIIKRPNYVSHLPMVLHHALERRRVENARRTKPLRVLYGGDSARARAYFSRTPNVHIEEAVLNANGFCSKIDPGGYGGVSYDVVVFDDQLAGVHPIQALKNVSLQDPDLPVILLAGSGENDMAVESLKLGAADLVVKTGNYFDRLFLAIDRVVRQRELTREKISLGAIAERLRTILELTPACVSVLNSDGTIRAMNWAGLSLAGAQRVDEIVGKSLFEMVVPPQRVQVEAFVERVVGGERDSIRFECEGLDGRTRSLELVAVPIRRDERATDALCVIHELAAPDALQKQQLLAGQNAAAPAALEEAEERIRRITAELEREREQTAAEHEALAIERKAAAGLRGAIEVLESQLSDLAGQLHKALEERGGAAADSKSEESRIKDITDELERSRMETESTSRELDKEREVVASLRAAVADAQGRLEAAYAFHALQDQNLCKTLEEHRDALQRATARETELAGRLESNRSSMESYSRELELRKAESDESRQLLLEAAEKQRCLEEKTLAERERLETKVSVAESSYRRLFASDLVGLAVTALDGTVLRCNRAFALMFGYESAAALLSCSADGEFRVEAAEEWQNATEPILVQREYTRRSDARRLRVLESVVRLTEPGETATLERAFVDISDQYALDEELRRSRRMEAVGRLTTTMAQDFHEVLTAMAGFSEALMEESDAPELRRKNAEHLHKAAALAGGMTRQLLGFSRRQERLPAMLGLNAVVEETESSLRRLVGEEIEFTTALSPDLGLVLADRQEIEQILIALVVHARMALPMGGRIQIETRNLAAGQSPGELQPPRVILLVSFSGFGVQPATLTPALESMVRQSGGSLKMVSNPETGISLRLLLPRSS